MEGNCWNVIRVSTSEPDDENPSALADTRVVYYCDNLDQFRKLPAVCGDLVYIDPPFNSNRNCKVLWDKIKEKRAFEDQHTSTHTCID